MSQEPLFIDYVFSKIGIPIYGALHVGKMTEETRILYESKLGLCNGTNLKVLDEPKNITDLSSFLNEHNVDIQHYNYLCLPSHLPLHGHLNKSLKNIHYIQYTSDKDVDDLLPDYRRVVSKNGQMLYRRPQTIYRYVHNASLRLGNVIHLLVHMLYFAEMTGSFLYFLQNPHEALTGTFNSIFYPWYGFRRFDQASAKMFLVEKNSSALSAAAHQWYFNPLLVPTERERRWIAIKYVSSLLPQPSPHSVLGHNHLVIHIRSGDLFSEKQHGHYMQPPLAYYQYILDNHCYEHVTIVTEPDKQNPVIHAIMEHYPHIQLQHKTLKEDVETILSARHLVIGTGSFGHTLSLCSRHIHRLYCFETHDMYYRNSDYDIVVLEVDTEKSSKHYPKNWENDVSVLINDEWVIREKDLTNHEETKKSYWDEFL